jgi:hypothetical protein
VSPAAVIAGPPKAARSPWRYAHGAAVGVWSSVSAAANEPGGGAGAAAHAPAVLVAPGGEPGEPGGGPRWCKDDLRGEGGLSWGRR